MKTGASQFQYMASKFQRELTVSHRLGPNVHRFKVSSWTWSACASMRVPLRRTYHVFRFQDSDVLIGGQAKPSFLWLMHVDARWCQNWKVTLYSKTQQNCANHSFLSKDSVQLIFMMCHTKVVILGYRFVWFLMGRTMTHHDIGWPNPIPVNPMDISYCCCWLVHFYAMFSSLMDWFCGENIYLHRKPSFFSHHHWGFPVNFHFNQSID